MALKISCVILFVYYLLFSFELQVDKYKKTGSTAFARLSMLEGFLSIFLASSLSE